jgi:hypothetical protein
VQSKALISPKSLRKFCIKLTMVRRIMGPGSQYQAVRPVLVLGKRVNSVLPMHAAISVKMCIWQTVFVVKNLCMETRETYQFH